MIPRDALLAHAIPEPMPVDGATEQKLARQLGPRKLAVPGSPRGAVRFPGGKALAEAAPRLLAPGSALGTSGVRLVFEALTKPLRVYEQRGETDDLRRLALLLSWLPNGAEVPSILVGQLTVPADGKDWSIANLEVTVIAGCDPQLNEVLEYVVRSTISEQRTHPDPDLPKPRELLWLGGSAAETGVGDWTERLWAAAAVRGFRARVVEQPARRFAETMRAINAHGGAVVVVWTPYCGARYEAFVNACSEPPIMIYNAGIDTAVEALREELDLLRELLNGNGSPEDAEGRDAPEEGEIRFYKKHYARQGGGDKMLDWHDCGHGNWTNDTYAPQAELGIRKLEGFHGTFILQKCKSCTGTGVWKVTF